ncbi:MAG: hypothetical protein ACXWJB_13660 [Limisphaerales bacterium]
MSVATFNCPACAESFRAPFTTGYGVACPKCQNTFVPVQPAVASSEPTKESLLVYAHRVQTFGYIAFFLDLLIVVYGSFQPEDRSLYYIRGAEFSGFSVFVLILAQLIFIRAHLCRNADSD